MIISRSVLRGMKNFSDKSCRENQNAHLISSNFFFSPENLAVYEIMWENMVETDRPRMTIWRMRFACGVTKAAEKHSVFVITPVAFFTATVFTRTSYHVM